MPRGQSQSLTAEFLTGLEHCTALTRLGDYRIACNVWQQLDSQNWKCYETLEELCDFCEMSAVAAEILSRRCPTLTRLQCLNQCNRRFDSDDVFKQLSGIKTLQSLELNGCHNITAGGYAHLKKLPALRHLELSECVCLDAALGHIKDIPILDTLIIDGCVDLSATGFAHLKECKSLTRLDFESCDGIRVADLAALSGMSLKCLSFGLQDDLTGAGFVHLRGLPLQHLLLSHCRRLTSECLAHIGCLSELRSLELGSYGGSTEGICVDVESVQSLSGLTELKYLSVCITEGAVECLLVSCKQLKKIGLRAPYISDAFIENLAARAIQPFCWGEGYPQ